MNQMCLVYNNGLDSSLELFTPKNFRDIPVIYKHFWMAKNKPGLLKIFWNVDILAFIVVCTLQHANI